MHTFIIYSNLVIFLLAAYPLAHCNYQLVKLFLCNMHSFKSKPNWNCIIGPRILHSSVLPYPRWRGRVLQRQCTLYIPKILLAYLKKNDIILSFINCFSEGVQGNGTQRV